MKSEASIEDELRQAVEAAGGIAIKLPATLYRGIPDRLVLLPGQTVVFVELKKSKAKTKRSTAIHQDRWAKFLQTLGFTYVTLEGSEGLEAFKADHL